MSGKGCDWTGEVTYAEVGQKNVPNEWTELMTVIAVADNVIDIYLFSFLQEHLIDCPYVDVTCRKCKGEFQRQHLELHLSKKCPYRIVQCAYCKADIPYYIKPVIQLQWPPLDI